MLKGVDGVDTFSPVEFEEFAEERDGDRPLPVSVLVGWELLKHV